MGIETTGIEETSDALNQLNDGLNDLSEELLVAMIPAQMDIAAYPMQNPNSKYVRTLNYGDSVSSAAGASNGVTTGIVGPDMTQIVPYTIYVRGDMDGYPGSWTTRPEWTPIETIAEQQEPYIEDQIDSAVNDKIAEAGLS